MEQQQQQQQPQQQQQQQQQQQLKGRRRPSQQLQQHRPLLVCPRCNSENTKFCYYNNYSTSQPRHFCRACRRHWTHGGSLRDIPEGGVKRSKRISSSSSSASSPSSSRNDQIPILSGDVPGNQNSAPIMQSFFSGGLIADVSGGVDLPIFDPNRVEKDVNGLNPMMFSPNLGPMQHLYGLTIQQLEQHTQLSFHPCQDLMMIQQEQILVQQQIDVSSVPVMPADASDAQRENKIGDATYNPGSTLPTSSSVM